MSAHITIYRKLGSVLVAALMAVSIFADTIRLKDGSIIKGTITGFKDGRFVVVIGEGERRRELTFAASEVESIAFDGIATSGQTAAKPARVSNNTPPPRVVISDTVGSTPPRPINDKRETAATVPVVDTSSRTTPPTTRKVSGSKPIEVNVKVLADNSNNGWTNSGWVVRKGQKIRISGSGEVGLGGARRSAPGGLNDVDDPTKLLKAVPTGALIAVIGDDNNDFIYIGTSREFVAQRDGALFLGINEGNLNDNTGAFEVKIEIDPESE